MEPYYAVGYLVGIPLATYLMCLWIKAMVNRRGTTPLSQGWVLGVVPRGSTPRGNRR